MPWRNFATVAPPRFPSTQSNYICKGAAIASLLFALTVSTAPAAYAQGCAQCLDSTRATPPAVQAAYRHAIYLLGGAGAAIFIAGVFLLRRDP